MRRTALFLLASVGLWLSWSVERGSVEHANRLHRSGQSGAATDIYQERAARLETPPYVRYNLGTSLIAGGIASGEGDLARAANSPTREVRARAQYNAGFSRLERALAATDADSARAHAAASVAANRNALLLLPGDGDAKWNLAMGLRLLDSIDAAARRSGREMADGDAQADVVVRSVNVPDAEEDERAQDPPAEGENETVAETGEEAPLTAAEAEEILGDTHLDATTILQKLLALEGRTRWGRQLGRVTRRW
jgi:hypothetical protein